MHKFKHAAMQSAFTNMGLSEELSEFKCGTVIGCHLCSKSVCKISSLLDIQLYVVLLEVFRNSRNSVMKRKIKWSHRAGHRVLRIMVCKSHQHSADSTAEELQTSSDINISTKTAAGASWMGFHGRQLHASLTSANTMASIRWSGVKHGTTGL